MQVTVSATQKVENRHAKLPPQTANDSILPEQP